MTNLSTPIKRPLYQKILVIFSLITLMGGTITGIMTYKNLGMTKTFMSDWFSSFAIAALIMIPAGFAFMTIIGKLVQFGMPKSKKIHQQLATGLSMAFVMESVMAASTTANTIGFSDKAAFVHAWQQAFLTALPFGMFMAVMMSLFLKPKIEKFMAS